jgi:hypothetical protein
MSTLWTLLLKVALIVVLSAANAKAFSALPAATSANEKSAHRGDPELQQKRLAFLQGAIGLGIISRIEDNGPITRVLIGQRFIALSIDEKEQILNVVWAYYKTEDPQKNVVLVIDQKSGKKLGEYSPANGGLKMK